MSDWQPIETAPRDGTRVLAWWPKAGDAGLVGIAEWTVPRGETYAAHWTWDGAWTPGIEPTHWQPLPPPPAGD